MTIKQDCPPHRYIDGRCVNRAARTKGAPEGLTCNAREPALPEQVASIHENIALEKLRLAKITGTSVSLTSPEVHAVMRMLESG